MKKTALIFSIIIHVFLQSCISDNEDPIYVAPVEGAIVEPNVGGPAEPHQVWIDLSDTDSDGQPLQTVTTRTKWDFGFYCGDQFKVILNNSIMMAAGIIEGAEDIDAVRNKDVTSLKKKVLVANFDPENLQYVDNVQGQITGHTAIAEVSEKDAANPVYLVNMGYDLYANPDEIKVGSVATAGASRGWKKVQVIREGDSYIIRYANLNDDTHKELKVEKNKSYNFTFISLDTDSVVSIQPEKKKWDLCFTVFTNEIEGASTYIYSDFVVNNILSGAAAYEVQVSSGSALEAYNKFTLQDVDESRFMYDDQRAIGSNWRNPVGTNGLELYGDRFYILKDPDGLYFKLKFNRMTSVSGLRGYPEFEYKPL